MTNDLSNAKLVSGRQSLYRLAVALGMDFSECSMYAYIEKLKSLEDAVKKFGRL